MPTCIESRMFRRMSLIFSIFSASLKPLMCNIRICFTIVLFPLSPAPSSSSRCVARMTCNEQHSPEIHFSAIFSSATRSITNKQRLDGIGRGIFVAAAHLLVLGELLLDLLVDLPRLAAFRVRASARNAAHQPHPTRPERLRARRRRGRHCRTRRDRCAPVAFAARSPAGEQLSVL